MSTTPDDNPAAPQPEPAPAVDAAVVEQAPAEEEATNGHSQEQPGEEAAAAEATAPTGEGGEKKRRRRRRKKKGGARAQGAEGEAANAEAKDDDAKEGRREKRKGPPRERPPVNHGDIVFGKIVEITDETILIDIPGKAKAIFDRREMLLPDDYDDRPPPKAAEEEAKTEQAPATGDTATPIDAAPEATPALEEPPKEPKVPHVVLEVGADFIGVVHGDGGRGGLVVLTHHPKRADKTKGNVETAFNEKTNVEGLVTGVIKGGVEVDVEGLRAFAPGSHVDLHMGADLHYLVGQRLAFAVTQYAKRGRDVVLSRKAIVEEEARKARAEALSKLHVGETREGIVRSVVPFGAFVDIGGIEGLVPLQEMSHNRGDGPSDVFKAGEPTTVKVIKIDDKGKVWLSRKATIADPWDAVASKYAQGTKHTGKVVRIQPFGAFVELEPGVDGLIHTADLSIKRIEAPEDVVKVADSIDVVVSHVDGSNKRIALHPALQGDAANEAPQKVVPHKTVKAKIVAIESGGLVVRVMGVTGRAARAYVTAAGTGTPRGTELRKSFKVDQEIEAKVVDIDPRRGEAKLSMKALSEDQERSAYQQYRQQLKAEARFTLGDLLKKQTSK